MQAAKVVTHILGLNAAGETTLELPAVGGGKKAGVYREIPAAYVTHADSGSSTGGNSGASSGIWSGEAEQYLLTHAEAISHD